MAQLKLDCQEECGLTGRRVINNSGYLRAALSRNVSKPDIVRHTLLLCFTRYKGDDFSTDERTLNLRKSIDVLSRTSILNSRLFLSIPFPPQYIIARYNNVVPRQDNKLPFTVTKSACIIFEYSIRSTLLAKN